MLEDNIDSPRTIQLKQQPPLLVIPHKRGSLLVIYFQAHLDRFATVIASLHKRLSASIANPIHLGRRKVYMERRLALRATSASTQCPHNTLSLDLQVHHPAKQNDIGSQCDTQKKRFTNSA